jgi:hydrogenase maturation protease
VFALGSEHNGDDRAALEVARVLGLGDDVVILGRPGVALIDAIERDAPVILVDAVRGIDAGTIVTLPLDSLIDRGLPRMKTSSHELAVVEALRLSRALGRPTPKGVFVGIGGATFAPGAPMSAAVHAAIDRAAAYVRAMRDALSRSHGSSPPARATRSALEDDSNDSTWIQKYLLRGEILHEHGLMTRLIERAVATCRARGGSLRAMTVRLGALSSADEAHFRQDFEHVCAELGLGPVALTVELAPDHPTGVELVRVEGACED